jgi:hypothetical protein
MKVSSPVGDFPFEPTSMRYENGNLVIEGAMGAWPATIRVGASDVPVVLRLLAKPLLAVLGSGALLLIALTALRR